MGHNEDGDKISVNSSFMVHARITEPAVSANEDASEVEEFTALCYAAELCGNAFGFNLNTGVVLTVNAVFPKKINSSAIRESLTVCTLCPMIPLIISSIKCVAYVDKHCAFSCPTAYTVT